MYRTPCHSIQALLSYTQCFGGMFLYLMLCNIASFRSQMYRNNICTEIILKQLHHQLCIITRYGHHPEK